MDLLAFQSDSRTLHEGCMFVSSYHFQQSKQWIFGYHYHAVCFILHLICIYYCMELSPPFSQNLKLSATYKLSWCGGRHSRTKMTPPQPNSCLQISRSLRRLETMTFGCTAFPAFPYPELQDSQTGISSCDESQAVTAQRSRACHL